MSLKPLPEGFLTKLDDAQNWVGLVHSLITPDETKSCTIFSASPEILKGRLLQDFLVEGFGGVFFSVILTGSTSATLFGSIFVAKAGE